MERGGRRVTEVPEIMGSSTDRFPVGMLSAREDGLPAQASLLRGHGEPPVRMISGWKQAPATARTTHFQAPKQVKFDSHVNSGSRGPYVPQRSPLALPESLLVAVTVQADVPSYQCQAQECFSFGMCACSAL